jgi:hypothetical protein
VKTGSKSPSFPFSNPIATTQALLACQNFFLKTPNFSFSLKVVFSFKNTLKALWACLVLLLEESKLVFGSFIQNNYFRFLCIKYILKKMLRCLIEILINVNWILTRMYFVNFPF